MRFRGWWSGTLRRCPHGPAILADRALLHLHLLVQHVASDFRLLPCALEVGLDEIDEVLLQ